MSKVGLGPDIQEWLVRGMEHVILQTPSEEGTEMRAFLQMLQSAHLVILVMPDKEGVAA